jgi:hypothetical protein
MKNKIFSLAFGVTLFAASVSAQETLTNKNGKEILPEAGDIGLGFNAVPVLTYIGNMFNGNLNNTSIGQNKFLDYFGENSVFAKYMLTDKSAIRASLGLNISNNNYRNFVIDDTQNSPDSLVTDFAKINTQSYNISAGYEMRRGNGRVQGIFGGEIFYHYSSGSRSYDYANQFGMLNQAPTGSDFNSPVPNSNAFNASPMGSRVISEVGGRTVGFGVRPFIGIEYYFAPKISIGAEFGWYLMYASTNEAVSTTEYFEPVSGNVLNSTNRVAGRNSFNMGKDNLNGAIYLMFYF